MKMGDEESLLRKMGVELQSLDSGCCGMAGAFGFEAGKFAVSQAIGERVLLPAVRAAHADTLIVSDGFSCREQIQQATGRPAIHLAEAMQLALDGQMTLHDLARRRPMATSSNCPPLPRRTQGTRRKDSVSKRLNLGVPVPPWCLDHVLCILCIDRVLQPIDLRPR